MSAKRNTPSVRRKSISALPKPAKSANPIMLDGTFKIPDTDNDEDAITNVWCLLILAYKYLGERFDLKTHEYPASDEYYGEALGVAQAQLYLAIHSLYGTFPVIDQHVAAYRRAEIEKGGAQ